MLKRQSAGKKQVKVTFVRDHLPEQPAISVVGDFNGWNPAAHRLVKRNNGTRSVAIVLDKGRRYEFRYYTEDGDWFNEEEADDYVPSEHGSENCVILT